MTTAIDYLDNWQNYDKESLINRIKEVNESNEGHIFTKGLANVMHNKFEKYEVTSKIKLLLVLCEVIEDVQNRKDTNRCMFNLLIENLWYLIKHKQFADAVKNKLVEYNLIPEAKDLTEDFKILCNPTNYLLNLVHEDDYISIYSAFENEKTHDYFISDLIDYTYLFNTLESFDHKNVSKYLLLGYIYYYGLSVSIYYDMSRNLWNLIGYKKLDDNNNIQECKLLENREEYLINLAKKDDYILTYLALQSKETINFFINENLNHSDIFNTLMPIENKNASIYFILSNLYLSFDVEGHQNATQKSKELLEKSVELNNFFMIEQAPIYEESDINKSIELYEKAIIAGNRCALVRLTNLLQISDLKIEDYILQKLLKIKDLKEKKKCLKYSPGNYGALMAQNNFYELASNQ